MIVVALTLITALPVFSQVSVTSQFAEIRAASRQLQQRVATSEKSSGDLAEVVAAATALRRRLEACCATSPEVLATEYNDVHGLLQKLELAAQEAAARARAFEAENRRRAFIRAKAWAANIEDAVLRREVVIGMTRYQAEASWGKPSQINETTTAAGIREQWVYGGAYLYFENGVLTAIQRTRRE